MASEWANQVFIACLNGDIDVKFQGFKQHTPAAQVLSIMMIASAPC
ncbi:hypothetical protein MJ560_24445 [Klebsiella pneumoniae]|nr:hypothetical protein MJ560_24445 [Klebsiella pneumoniae]